MWVMGKGYLILLHLINIRDLITPFQFTSILHFIPMQYFRLLFLSPHPLSHGSCNKTITTRFYRETMAQYFPLVLITRLLSLTLQQVCDDKTRYQYLGESIVPYFSSK